MKLPVPACNLVPRVSRFCFEEWQDIWSNYVNNKLYTVYQFVSTAHHNKTLSRHEAVIINRLRIDHTRLTHSYLVSGDDQLDFCQTTAAATLSPILDPSV